MIMVLMKVAVLHTITSRSLTYLLRPLNNVLILNRHQNLPLRNMQRCKVLEMARSPRPTRRHPVMLLLLQLESKMILPSPFLLYLLLSPLYHPLLIIDVLISIGKKLGEVMRKPLLEREKVVCLYPLLEGWHCN